MLKSGRQVLAVLAAAALAVVLTPAGIASAAQHCHLAAATNKWGCNGSDGIRGDSDVIGVKLFTGTDYTRDSMTIWVPRPCPDDGNVNWFISIKGTAWQNKVRSVQAWGNCWAWLYTTETHREGPYKGNDPDVTYVGNYTMKIGLS
ncbi:hypothetical protein [Amycolatopsis sp. NPDC057786]|uniref:hypothetical protein n=1 Tax=Amycolatopsis sp. NPDC057786 TaxID=3346250 RepID=UPI00366C72F3